MIPESDACKREQRTVMVTENPNVSMLGCLHTMEPLNSGHSSWALLYHFRSGWILHGMYASLTQFAEMLCKIVIVSGT